jgi:hypothetical protein
MLFLEMITGNIVNNALGREKYTYHKNRNADQEKKESTTLQML